MIYVGDGPTDIPCFNVIFFPQAGRPGHRGLQPGTIPLVRRLSQVLPALRAHRPRPATLPPADFRAGSHLRLLLLDEMVSARSPPGSKPAARPPLSSAPSAPRGTAKQDLERLRKRSGGGPCSVGCQSHLSSFDIPPAPVRYKGLRFHAHQSSSTSIFIGICGTAMGAGRRRPARPGLHGHRLGRRHLSADVHLPGGKRHRAQPGLQTREPALPRRTSSSSGNAIRRGNPEVEEVLNRKLLYSSLPEVLKQSFPARHGTTSWSAAPTARPPRRALLAWVLQSAGLAPGYMIGGLPKNLPSRRAMLNARRTITSSRVTSTTPPSSTNAASSSITCRNCSSSTTSSSTTPTSTRTSTRSS